MNAEITARNGHAKDVVTTKRNRRFVSAKAARLSEAADVARTAARQLAAAKARILEDVAKAEAAGFIVQEDFSITDSTSGSLGSPTRADDYAAAIKASVTDLVALDEQLAPCLHAAAEEPQDLSENAYRVVFSGAFTSDFTLPGPGEAPERAVYQAAMLLSPSSNAQLSSRFSSKLSSPALHTQG